MNGREPWVHLLAYNLVRLLMAQAQPAMPTLIREGSVSSALRSCGRNGVPMGVS